MDKSTERVSIFIDGSNFYRRIKDPSIGILKGTKLAYNKFADLLANGRKIIEKKYFIGIVRNHDNSQRSADMVKSQQKLLSELQNCGYVVEKGKIVYDHNIREKGVDVKIAIDLVVGAADNQYDTAILVSSDTDLLPAVRYVKSKGRKIEYVGFSFQPTIGLIKECSDSRLLTASDIQSCL